MTVILALFECFLICAATCATIHLGSGAHEGAARSPSRASVPAMRRPMFARWRATMMAPATTAATVAGHG